MLVTCGVGRAHEAFAAIYLEFQIVGDFFASRMITKNQSTSWVLK